MKTIDIKYNGNNDLKTQVHRELCTFLAETTLDEPIEISSVILIEDGERFTFNNEVVYDLLKKYLY